jgi:hypothetical protein
MLITHVSQDWNATSSSSLPRQARISPSKSLSGQGYQAYQGDPVHQGGQALENLTVGQQGWNPHESMPQRDLGENRYPGYTRQATDVRMRSPSSPRVPSSHEGQSLAGYSSTSNVRNTGNTFTGINYGARYQMAVRFLVLTAKNPGNVHMEAYMTTLSNEFMVCFISFHRSRAALNIRVDEPCQPTQSLLQSRTQIPSFRRRGRPAPW